MEIETPIEDPQPELQMTSTISNKYKICIAPLGQVCEIISGQSPASEFYNKKGIGLPFYQGKADFGERFPTTRVWCSNPLKLARENDILFCVRAPVGPTNVATEECCIGRGLAAIRASESVDPTYLLHVLRSAEPRFAQYSNGSTFKAITRSDLCAFEIPLPPLPEQKRIAEILDKADAIRRKRAQALELTDQFLQSVFLDMFGDPVMNPKGWDTCAVEELCSEIVDCPHSTPIYSTETTEFPCIRTSDLQAGYLDWSTTKYVSREEYQRRISRLCPTEGDILYSREGERFGIAARVQPNTTPCLGQRMMLFRPDLTQATAGFLWAVLNSRSVYTQARNLVSGSTSPHVNVRDIKQFLVPQPPMALQHSFAAIIAALDSFRAKHAIHASESTELFSSLVQQAFRGEM